MDIRQQVINRRKEYEQVFNAFHLASTAGAIDALNEVLAMMGDPADDGPEVDLLRLVDVTDVIEAELGYPTAVVPGVGIPDVEHPAGGGFTLIHMRDGMPIQYFFGELARPSND